MSNYKPEKLASRIGQLQLRIKRLRAEYRVAVLRERERRQDASKAENRNGRTEAKP